jgi:bloom syndrome protein
MQFPSSSNAVVPSSSNPPITSNTAAFNNVPTTSYSNDVFNTAQSFAPMQTRKENVHPNPSNSNSNFIKGPDLDDDYDTLLADIDVDQVVSQRLSLTNSTHNSNTGMNSSGNDYNTNINPSSRNHGNLANSSANFDYGRWDNTNANGNTSFSNDAHMGGGSSSNGAPTFDNDSGGHNNDSYGTHNTNTNGNTSFSNGAHTHNTNTNGNTSFSNDRHMGGGSSSNGAPTFDNDSGGHNNDSYGTHSNNYSEPSSSNNNDTPPCPGHNMPCRLLMANTASNMGRQFYKCSMPEGQACDFFEWADGMEGNMNNDLDNGGGSIVSGSKKDMYTENQRIFGHRSFRLGQKEVIQQAISGRDVFVLMPTGGGKSLCYQLPAWCCPGVAIIVSPLLSLIQDQVQSMTKVGVRSVFLNSKQDYETEQKDILQELEHNTPAHGGIKLLYLTPEKLTHSTSMKRILRKLYERGLLSRIVVDEAHCLSDWGHDFRPDYNQLGKLRREFPNTPLMALTATANEKVVNDAIRALGMRNEYTYRSSFNRKNLHYEVRKKDGKVVDAIADHIATKPRESGVVYCLSRKNCEDVAKKLQGKLREKGCGHIRVSFYHAQVEQTERDRRHHAWSIGKISVLCATIAFGMGIDKPGKSCLLNMERSPCPSSNADTLFAACTDVRYVIHYSMPKSITH